MSTVDARQRTSILFLAVVYVVGFLAGRAGRERAALQGYMDRYGRGSSSS